MTGELAGQYVGQYQLVEKIGQGGMASVYKAHQASISRYVAVKILTPNLAVADQNFVKRFIGEAKAAAALEHPHILPLYDFGTQDALVYMVMRLVEGGTLADVIIQPQHLTYSRTVTIACQIAEALDYAHSQGIVHRDVKPSNILIDQHQTALLTDFGLARVIAEPYTDRLTGSGTVVGTASYMSPEQAADESIDGRSDIYSLGIVLFEMLARQLPFQADTPVATALKHVQAPIPSLRAINPEVPESFEQIVNKALAKWPDERYQTAAEMSRALRTALRELDDPGQPAIHAAAAPPADVGPAAAPQRKDQIQHHQEFTETVPLEAEAPSVMPEVGSAKRSYRLWVWIGVVAIVAALAAFFVWQGIVSPGLPEDSLLTMVPQGGEIAQSLGERTERQARVPYSRQHFSGGMMYWWDNPTAGVKETVLVMPNNDQAGGWSRHTIERLPEPIYPDDCPIIQTEVGPVRNFGKLWCYDPAVNGAMGTPLAPGASGNNATVEIFNKGLVISVPVDSQVRVLMEDGTWRVYGVEF